MNDILKKNDEYTVEIISYSSLGYGVCRVNGRAIFVPNTLIGEKWKIKLLKVTSSAAYAKGIKCFEASPERIENDCPHYPKCGGCNLRHMSYREECSFKLSRVNDALRHIGKQDFIIDELIPAESTEAYRNMAIFNVDIIDGLLQSGFYRERSHDLIPINNCLIQKREANLCAGAVIDFMNENGFSTGYLRNIFCRKAVYTDDFVLCIVSSKGFGSKTSKLTEYLLDKCPFITGIVLNINRERENTILSGDFYTLYGRGEMRDILCGNEFEISPQAFYQINPVQAEKLYEIAAQFCEGAENVLELYCGAGTISLCLAKKAKHVTAAEIVPEAVENAKQNAATNCIKNVDFICADAAYAAKKYNGEYDTVVVDPPRSGMDEETIKNIATINPHKIVYISCNPSTLARDILKLAPYGYKLEKGTAVDMFPRTSHVETVCLLSKLSTAKHHVEVS